MKRYLIIISLLLPFLNRAADNTTNTPPTKVGTAAATQYYDKLLTVTGTVAQVTIRPNIVFINLDKPYPDSPFTAIIHGEATNQFGNLKALKGKAVEITGKVKNYHDKPEIVLESSNQVVVTSSILTTNPPAN